MLLSRLFALGAPRVVLTGVAFTEGKTGVLVAGKDGDFFHYEHERVGQGFHGTGDVYASAFTGALLQGKTAEEAAVLAAEFTVAAIRATVGDESHLYGVKFEKVLSLLTEKFGDR
jgi:pyridoxine kinase